MFLALPRTRLGPLSKTLSYKNLIPTLSKATPSPKANSLSIHSRLFSTSLYSRTAIDNSYPPKSSSVALENSLLRDTDVFYERHIGPRDSEIQQMLNIIGVNSIEELLQKAIPQSIRLKEKLEIPDGGLTEQEMLSKLSSIAKKNKVYKSYIGMGYNNVVTPPVILRSLLENPSWYTQYTPYQAEISQGRLESLLNFQTMIQDLTGLSIANASLLDEGTAAGEALSVCINSSKGKGDIIFFADRNCHPQTIKVLQTRAQGLNTTVIVDDYSTFDFDSIKGKLVGALVSYPDTYGNINNYTEFSKKIHEKGGQLVVSADIMALTVLTPPSEFGADIAIGNTQRFGVSLGYGGPHAAYFATTDVHKRKIPGRLVGVSIDSKGRTAYRLALQTREQHIRRDKATSNICTAQALLANIAAMYAVYHGPKRIQSIANRIHRLTFVLSEAISSFGHQIENKTFFDTLLISVAPGYSAQSILQKAESQGINLRPIDESHVGVSLDESVSIQDLENLINVFSNQNSTKTPKSLIEDILTKVPETVHNSANIPQPLARKGEILTHPIFHKYHSETEMLRYLTLLQNRDLSLANAMIPLGSCTMKLNATSEMIPITWPEFANIHPFAPKDQTAGYSKLIADLEDDLARMTGMNGSSVQPNSGAQGEYSGLRVIRAYQESIGQGHRNICLVPTSAHGTNPASAVMANLKVITVKCDGDGYLDLNDLKAKAEKHSNNLSSVMITYPSTYGIFEEGILEATKIIHSHGGQVYMDGANLNAQIGLCNPGDMGADVCHINSHKSLCIPHGGGGPGVGPICVKSHLVPFLPGHPYFNDFGVTKPENLQAIGPVSAAQYGSAGILPITWAYIKMMGGDGLRRATEMAILNANYMAKRLSEHYPILYTNKNNMCAHEFIIDLHSFVKSANVSAVDVAKRLQDFGIHPPTMSWPVPHSLMVEPTESESKQELDKFCDAMIQIRMEIKQIEEGKMPNTNNVLTNSPHPLIDIISDTWDKPYSREDAAYPLKSLRDRKFWPTISRIDDTYGDSHLVCSCPPISDYE
ncbi:hypothetical protein BB559_000430 [Furculomyces boomerangus]|uniref:Glycine cleavage system P protein n=1 Tax=Furculomyces boomerangus TaxID=61424 RepID=A0A2T9Z582_9FUNG|nr:hypothetical protein BB559_000430 [Furculomyces boomerangus]